MKKFITTITLFAAGTAFAAAGDYSTTLTSGTSGNGNYYGFCLKLTDSFLTTTPEGVTLPDMLVLDSVSLLTRTSGDEVGNTAYLALYEYTADSTTGTFVAVSTNQQTSNTNNATLTFNFSSGLQISSEKQYQFMFVNSNTAISSFGEYQAAAVQLSLNVLQQSSLSQGDGTYKSNEINSWEGMYIPNVTIVTSTIPEPSAFGLLAGVGALALVAARRRRRSRAK